MMKNIFTVSLSVFLLGLASVASATTIEGILDLAGRSIPENSITIDGALSGVVGKAFILDGSKSQDDGTMRTYLWRQVSGPIVTLSDPSALSLSVVPKVAGSYVFDLVATDATGLSTVVQKAALNIADAAAVTSKTSPISGDPDFDLLKIAPISVSIGDVNRDGSVEAVLNIAPRPATASSTKRGTPGVQISVGAKTTGDKTGQSDASAGLSVQIGDPDFDLLRIEIDSDGSDQVRAEVSAMGVTGGVRVRGWDPEKKEEIVGRPEETKTPADLKVYIEALTLSDAAIKGITLREGVAEIATSEPGKLFGFIPVSMSSNVAVDFNLKDTTADPVDVNVKLPWWSMFVKKSFSSSALEKELHTGLSGGIWQKVDNSDMPVSASMVARTLGFVSNVLKTKHDTAKNSVSNVR